MSRACKPHSSPRRAPVTTTSHRYRPSAALRLRASAMALATSSGEVAGMGWRVAVGGLADSAGFRSVHSHRCAAANAPETPWPRPRLPAGSRGRGQGVSGAFAAAQRWEWTDRNPAESAKPPTATRQPIPATSPEDVAKAIAEARSRSAALGLYLWLVVVTGARRGELCGLQARDIYLDQGLIHVAFNYVVRGGQRVRKDTKTHQVRWLAIDPDTSTLIAAELDEIRAALAAVGSV